MCDIFLFCNIFVLLWLKCSAYIFHPQNTIKYTGPEYFGYSVFLQYTGNAPPGFRTIVGSPKTDNLFICTGNVCNVTPIRLKSSLNELLGASIHGGYQPHKRVLACSPRYITSKYRTNGRCVILKDDAVIDELTPLSGDISQIRNYNGTYEYLYGHGQAGFSTKYVFEEDDFLLGAPGYLSWKGSIIKYSLGGLTRLNPERKTDKDSYLGYSIDYGRFPYGRNIEMLILAGAPRGSELRGAVFVFDYHNFNTHIITTLQSDQLGSYFGSSVLVVSRNDQNVSALLVGAPTYAIKTYDEGCVFVYYSNGVDFVLSEKICGKYKGGRFGAAMVSLGHVNQDLHEDIAIAAPYEDDGRGAVYIYVGGPDGFKECEKITAKSIDDKLRGFGFSLSNAIDVDHNGNNDFAIGAYKSNTVVVFKSRLVLECNWEIKTSVDRIQDTTQQFSVQICILYKTLLDNRRKITAHLIIAGDDRVLVSSLIQVLNMEIGAQKCIDIIAKPKHQTFDSPSPLVLKITSELLKCTDCPVSSPAECVHTHKIPFVTGCGDDNICMPKLKVDAHFNTKEPFVVIGTSDTLSFTVNITNEGESAYLCKLEVNLRSVDVTQIPSLCTKNGYTLNCDIANRLKTNEMKSVTFEIDMKNVLLPQIVVDLAVSSSGEGDGKSNMSTITLPLTLQSNITVSSFSDPQYLFYTKERSLLTFSHEYTIHNAGPSPLVFYGALFEVPEQYLNDDGVVISGFEIKPNMPKCLEPRKRDTSRSNLYMLDEISNSRKFSLPCNSKLVSCQKFACVPEHLPVNRAVKFKFTLVGNATNLIKFYEKQLENKDLLVIESTSFIRYTDDDTITTPTYTILQREMESEVIGVWVWILSIIGAIVILAIIMFILYKVKFFARPMREKLRNEDEEMESHECIMAQSMDDEDLSS